jgi:uncharacterized membrane protein
MRNALPRVFGNALTLLKITTAVTVTLSLLAVPYRAGKQAVTPGDAPTYAVTEITVPGYEHSGALAVSENGIVVGEAWNGSSCGADRVPFVWRDGVGKALRLPDGFKRGAARACNANGEIVGWTSNGEGHVYATYWRGNYTRAVRYKDHYASYTDINERGECVGVVINPEGEPRLRAFRATGDAFAFLGEFYASNITDAGSVTGYALEDRKAYPVVWKDGALDRLPVPSGFPAARATRGSDDGRVVGMAGDQKNGFAAFVWEGGLAKRLGLGEVMAADLNRSGDVLLIAREKNNLWPVLWRGGEGVNLNHRIPADSGWRLAIGYEMNERGQIAGIGVTKDGLRGFLLTPNP